MAREYKWCEQCDSPIDDRISCISTALGRMHPDCYRKLVKQRTDRKHDRGLSAAKLVGIK